MEEKKKEFIKQASIQTAAALVKCFHEDNENLVNNAAARKLLANAACDIATTLADTLEDEYYLIFGPSQSAAVVK